MTIYNIAGIVVLVLPARHRRFQSGQWPCLSSNGVLDRNEVKLSTGFNSCGVLWWLSSNGVLDGHRQG